MLLTDRIHKFIEAHVAITLKGNVIQIQDTHSFLVDEDTELPLKGAHFIEPELKDLSDEIQVDYTLIKYENEKATYHFNVVETYHFNVVEYCSSTETYVVLISCDDDDARKKCEQIKSLNVFCQDKNISSEITKKISSEITKKIEVDEFYIYSISDFMEMFNDEQIDDGSYFISYVNATYTIVKP